MKTHLLGTRRALTNRRKTRDRWGSPKARREQFLSAVFFLATTRDLTNETAEAQLIINHAARIAAEGIPPVPLNAARVFMQFVDGHPKSAFRWMHCFEEVA